MYERTSGGFFVLKTRIFVLKVMTMQTEMRADSADFRTHGFGNDMV